MQGPARLSPAPTQPGCPPPSHPGSPHPTRQCGGRQTLDALPLAAPAPPSAFRPEGLFRCGARGSREPRTGRRTPDGSLSWPRLPRQPRLSSWCCSTASPPRSGRRSPSCARTPTSTASCGPRDGGAGLGLKSVDRETALLFLTLREPGPLPSYVRAMLGRRRAPRRWPAWWPTASWRSRTAGRSSSGAAALALLVRPAGPPRAGGRLAEISLAALRYAQDLAVDDPLALSFRLYGYNRRPADAGLEAALAQGGTTCSPGSGSARRRPEPPAPRPRAWQTGGSHRVVAELALAPGRRALGGGAAPTWKLYVSPAPEALPESFGEILEALAAARAAAVQGGSGRPGHAARRQDRRLLPELRAPGRGGRGPGGPARPASPPRGCRSPPRSAATACSPGGSIRRGKRLPSAAARAGASG